MNETSAVQPTEEVILKVGGGSSPQSTASAIAHSIYAHRQAHLRAVGASAVNQAVKAIAIARGYVAPRGFDLICKPGFTTIESKDGEISAVVFTVTVQ